MASGAPATGAVDVFKLVSDRVAEQESKAMQDSASGVECELLFVGAKNSGKSTLIHSFLMKEDTPKPTTALEYRFARRSTGEDKAVANIWELGGGSQLSSSHMQAELLQDGAAAGRGTRRTTPDLMSIAMPLILVTLNILGPVFARATSR